MRVVSYNIRHGRGTDDQLDLQRTASVLRALQPDIVGLQEVDSSVTRSERVAQADSLGKLLGMHASFGGFFAYQGGQYGMGVLSRYPIVRVVPIRLPDGNEPRIALRVDVAPMRADTFTVVNVHFDWVRNDSFRYAQAERLWRALDSLPYPFMVIGDYNDVPESRTLALFKSRMLEARKPENDRLTFSSETPEREIDHIYLAPADAWRVDSVRVISEPVASDHRPVFVKLRLQPRRR